MQHLGEKLGWSDPTTKPTSLATKKGLSRSFPRLGVGKFGCMPSFAPKPMKGTLPQGWETRGDWRRDAFQFPTPQLRALRARRQPSTQPPQEMVTPPSLAFRRQLLPKPAQTGNNKRKTFHKPEPRNLCREPGLGTGEEGYTPLDLSIQPPSTPTGPAGTQQLGNKGASFASRRDPGGLGVRVGSRGPGGSGLGWGDFHSPLEMPTGEQPREHGF